MQKAFFRNAIALIVSIIVLAGTREKFRIKRESWPWLILRSVFGSLGIFCNFWALSRLTIADASILNKMSPFFAIIMSIFILHELPGAHCLSSNRPQVLPASLLSSGSQADSLPERHTLSYDFLARRVNGDL